MILFENLVRFPIRILYYLWAYLVSFPR